MASQISFSKVLINDFNSLFYSLIVLEVSALWYYWSLFSILCIIGFRLEIERIFRRVFCFYFNSFCIKILFTLFTLTKNEIVMKIEKINIPPSPYRWRVRLPDLSINGIEIKVIITITIPMPIVAYLAPVSDKPVVVNKLVE